MNGISYTRPAALLTCLSVLALSSACQPVEAHSDRLNKNQAPLAPASQPGDWTQQGFDAAGTRLNPFETELSTGNVANLDEKWSNGLAGTFVDPLTVSNGTVYAPSYGSLTALDVSTGRLRWKTFLSDNWENMTGAAISNGTIFVGFSGVSTTLFAVDAATGKKLWKFDVREQWSQIRSPTVANGIVYLSTDYDVFALSSHTGRKLWSHAVPHRHTTSAAVADGLVYFGSDNYLVALDAKTGKRRWRASVTDATTTAPPAPSTAAGFVYISPDDHYLHALDAKTGEELWHFQADGLLGSAAIANGRLYVSSAVTTYALSADSGNLLWSFKKDNEYMWEPSPIVANGIVYDASWYHCYALAADSGRLLWKYASGHDQFGPNGIESNPVVSAGTLFLPMRSQTVALDARHEPRPQPTAFTEVQAQDASSASTTTVFPWYDNKNGFKEDQVEVINPGAEEASVSVSVPGQGPLKFTVTAGETERRSFPAAVTGGPVTVNSSQPVLASQKTQYGESLSELWGQSPDLASTSLMLPQYDNLSKGFKRNYILVTNPANSGTAHVKIQVHGREAASFDLGSNKTQPTIVPFAVSDGPVAIDSDLPVLASQRVIYNNSFSELNAQPTSEAKTKRLFPWYDNTSNEMKQDKLLLTNPGEESAYVQIILADNRQEIDFSVDPGTTVTKTLRSITGGPVKISSNYPVLATQQVFYGQSFTEFWSQADPPSPGLKLLPWLDTTSSSRFKTWLLFTDRNEEFPPFDTVSVSVGDQQSFDDIMTASDTMSWFAGPLFDDGPVNINSDAIYAASERILYSDSDK